jgi:acetolactate synthase-1/2/3 large subunit
MIRISQNNLFDSRVAGSTTSSGISFPDFGKLADLFGLEHVVLEKAFDWKNQLTEGLKSTAAVLFEVIMNPEQKYLPRLATSKLSDGTLISPPLEDLDPLLELSDLEKFLGYPAHQNSRRARGIQ